MEGIQGYGEVSSNKKKIGGGFIEKVKEESDEDLDEGKVTVIVKEEENGKI